MKSVSHADWCLDMITTGVFGHVLPALDLAADAADSISTHRSMTCV